MPVSEYDAIITNFGGSDFTAYYKKGINIKLSDGATVVNIYKPGTLKKNKYEKQNNEYYKDAMIEMSGNSTNMFHYQDLLKLQESIEKAIDYLNKENENLIDRDKECSYETIEKEPPKKKRTSALRYADLEIGGIYKDNKEKEWIFLGEAEYYENNQKHNRIGCNYIYMPNIDGLEKVDENRFRSKESLLCTIDSYASKKRFFEKVGQLEVNPNMSITFIDNYRFYAIYGNSVTDKLENEQKIANEINKIKLENEKNKQELELVQRELLTKIINSNEKLSLTIDFKENKMVNLKLVGLNIQEEFNLKESPEFYRLLFLPTLSIVPMKNQDNLGSIDQISKNQENNSKMFDYIADSSNLTLIVKNKDNDFVRNIKETVNNYILNYQNKEEKGKGAI